ncbi:MAG: FAD/NAD(P)-binding oxidoreductase [Rhodospirillales bacterium]
MKKISRRNFSHIFGGAATVALGSNLFPSPSLTSTRPRVVIIGGGAGGATVARHLAQDFPRIDVTLVEANKHYTASYFSNRYVGGINTLESITHSYEILRKKFGINVVHDLALRIDGQKRTVTLKGGDTLSWDRLVVAPGIDFKFNSIDGYDEAVAKTMPHAYKSDAQVSILMRQLREMKDGGLFVISVPKRPYRCPPAPYERAAMAAFYMKYHKPRSKIIILDAKDEYPLSEVLSEIWESRYQGMVEWVPSEFGGEVMAVDAKTRTLITGEEKFRADVANVIPPHHAGKIAQVSGLVDNSGWCPVNPLTFESSLAPAIHLVGDAIDSGDMPKAAFAANNQALACSDSVGAALTGIKAKKHVLKNTCFFLAAGGYGLKLGGSYKATTKRLVGVSGFSSQVGEPESLRRKTADEGEAWYKRITKDMFGRIEA